VKEEEEDFVDEILKEIENQNFKLGLSEDGDDKSVSQSDWSGTKFI
jgi:ribosome assembly protein YihI (activator of Der GTPase)